MHELQQLFAQESRETDWQGQLHALIAAGAFDQAEALLAEVLAALDSELAWTCLELPRDRVVLTGWDELAEAIAIHEGEPVTGVTIAIGNEPDLAFAKGSAHRPHVVLGIYTDEAFAFSRANAAQLLDQCRSHEPAWAAREEDIEVHLAIEGLDALNTCLLHHKQRHFFRDGEAETPAPLRYVEFVLGCWWRALRWQQAVAAQSQRLGLPGAPLVVAGMVDMHPGAVAVHTSDPHRTRPALQLVGGRDVVASVASLDQAFIQRRPSEDAGPPSPSPVTALRRQIRDHVTMQPPQTGLLARIFGWG